MGKQNTKSTRQQAFCREETLEVFLQPSVRDRKRHGNMSPDPDTQGVNADTRCIRSEDYAAWCRCQSCRRLVGGWENDTSPADLRTSVRSCAVPDGISLVECSISVRIGNVDSLGLCRSKGHVIQETLPVSAVRRAPSLRPCAMVLCKMDDCMHMPRRSLLTACSCQRGFMHMHQKPALEKMLILNYCCSQSKDKYVIVSRVT